MFISFTLPIICYGTQLKGIASFETPKNISVFYVFLSDIII